MSSTAKISISVPDEDLLSWAKKRSKTTGQSLSSVFIDAVRFERQMEARRTFLAELGAEAVPTAEEVAAIHAEWGERLFEEGQDPEKLKASVVKALRSIEDGDRFAYRRATEALGHVLDALDPSRKRRGRQSTATKRAKAPGKSGVKKKTR
jgi:hypothetical protein